jgi:hypothetical protein
MKPKAQVIEEFKDYEILINAVIDRIGMDSVEDAIHYGMNEGFNGFNNPTDRHAFALQYQREIVELLKEEADILSIEAVDMVANFGVFSGAEMDAEDRQDLSKYLRGGRPSQGTITNLMAWYTAEEVCRFFEDTDFPDFEDN